MDTTGRTAVLRRSPIARLRTLGFLGIVSWVVLLALVVDIVDGRTRPTLVALAVVAAVIRLAIATEYVRCDEAGLHWRSVLVTRHVPWEQVAGIETAVTRTGRLQGWMTFPVACMVVVLPDGSQHQMTASIWTPIMRHAEFIAEARMISTHDWADIALPRPGR